MDKANKTPLHVTAANNGYTESLLIGRNLPATGTRPARTPTEYKDVKTGTLCDCFNVTIIHAKSDDLSHNSLNLVRAFCRVACCSCYHLSIITIFMYFCIG